MPRLFFTARSVAAIKPIDKQTDWWDANQSGFGIRVTPKGKKTWTMMYRHQRRLKRFTLGRYPALSLAEALKKFEQATGDLAKDIDPANAKDALRASSTFKEFSDVYLTRYAKVKKRSWRYDERAINRYFVPRWGTRRLSAVSRRDIQELLDTIVARNAKIMANRCLALLKTMFNFAVNNGWVSEHPCARLPRPANENVRSDYLQEDQIRNRAATRR